MREHSYYFYIVSNYNRDIFYCGVCNDITRRLIEHKYSFGSEFTKKYNLKYLIYYEEYQYIHDAIDREKEIKKWRREKKINLIKTINSKMIDLGEELLEDFENEEIKEIVSDLQKLYFTNN